MVDPIVLMGATLMYFELPSLDPNLAPIQRMAESGDLSFAAPLVDLLLFSFALPLEVVEEIHRALTQLTGESFPDAEWKDWFTWLGQRQDVTGPPGYARWKGQLYSFIDPEFPAFFKADPTPRIRFEEIVWGGVRKDGIPDLTDPPVVAAADASYLEDQERVFGVSINGAHRAYPFRILNPHEMANDIVGGEPISLAY